MLVDRFMKNLFLAGVLLSHQMTGVDGYEPAVWISNKNMLACSPETLRASDSLVLMLGSGHGRELAIRRVADNAWYFLIGVLPVEGEPQLMTSAEFSKAGRVEISASFKARASENGPLEPIFHRPGAYEVYVSDNLESEEGGYVCRLDYVAANTGGSINPDR